MRALGDLLDLVWGAVFVAALVGLAALSWALWQPERAAIWATGARE